MIYFIEKRHISSYRKTIYDSSAKPLLSAGTEKIHGEEQHRKRRLTHRSTDFIGTAPEEY